MSTTAEAPPLKPADAIGGLPHKAFDVTFTSLDDTGSFAMTAAVFGNVDRGGDVISPGAFANLDEFAREGWVALSHDQKALPIAIVDTANQDAAGLQITGRFHSTEFAQECRTVFKERMEAGKTVKASIGYVTNDESYERINGKQVRRLKSVSLYEVSFVNLPMNPLSYVHSVKSLSEGDTMPEKPVETKRSVAISAANHKMLKAYGDAMDEHHTKMSENMKSMKDCHKAMTKTHGEMKEFIKGFAPASEADEEDGDDDEEEVEVVVEKPRKKPAKAAETEPEPRALTQEQRTLATFHDQLRRRANAGRKIQACP